MKNNNLVAAAALALLLWLPSLTSAAADPFGVTQLYPTTSGGKEWTSNWANGVARTFTWGADPQDSWFFGKGNATYSVDGQGNFLISGAVPRMYIYNPTLATGWRNVEMTVYAMRVADSGTAYGGVVGAARTNHTADTVNLCDTRGIMGRFRYDGHIDLEKETSHPNSVAIQNKTVFSGGLPKNKWIGYKLVVYDLPNGNVKVENYMDQTDGAGGGTWVKVNELEDTGKNFGVGGKACKAGIDPALRLTAGDVRAGSETGKPNLAVYWRSDNVGTNGLKYKKMSVREIAAGTSPSPTADKKAPIISGVAATGVGRSSATVSWTTNEAADTQVEFGPTASYGSWSAYNAALATGHSAALTGLTAGTLYHYRAKSRDAAGNMAVSADGTFTTAAPPPPPPPPAGTCIASSGLWANTSLSVQTGQFTAEFDATPGIAPMDGVAGLSNGTASAYAALAASVRFNNAGLIDARNGSGFAAATAIPYSPNLAYRFRLVVNLPAHTYSAYVKQGGSPERTIGTDFAFRTEQYAVSSLNNVGVIASAGSEAVCGAVATAAAPTAPATAFFDAFTGYPTNSCLADGATFGAWKSAYAGYGCTQIKTDGTRSWLDQAPLASVSAAETHASMVIGPAFSTPYTLTLDMNTFAQLRKNDPPNAWETAWVVWHYTDDEHFYYFTLKPNGWELGKRDPAYPGGQRFLATGPSPTLRVGAWNKVAVAVSGGSMQVSIDGQPVTSFTDGERPYAAGAIGLYNEDANVRFTDVAVTLGGPATLAALGPAPAAAPAAVELARSPQRFLSPALADGINDAAVFGREADEVSVFNLLGREVFRASRQGGNPIVWDCKDGSGRVRESGVYIARIRRSDSEVLFQSFALVK